MPVETHIITPVVLNAPRRCAPRGSQDDAVGFEVVIAPLLGWSTRKKRDKSSLQSHTAL